MSAPLGIERFPEFFQAVHRYQPFPWQERLALQVHRTGAWPDLLDLPTGSGKTAVLDIAAFLLACDAAAGVVQRFPRRTVLVVDRRVVVDQAAVAGRALLDALRHPQHEVVALAADALRRLSGTDVPLVTGALRGGIVRDNSWARRPDVPALLSSTVDQVGSRLLFRGYGVSASMRPVHAGLLGNDVLLLLDEVHLSQPFAQTLRAIGERYHGAGTGPVPRRWSVVELSATPSGPDSRAPFRLDPDSDLDPDRSGILRRRVVASKPVQLQPVKAKKGDRRPLVGATVKAVTEVLEQEHVRTVGVVVNRVRTASEIAGALREQHGLETLLLTGRMRPLERDERLGQHHDRLRTGRTRTDGEPLVVVGTQCIEAGADFDFDALVTECASLDALKQRFGRLDRNGELSAAGTAAPGRILALQHDTAAGSVDPVYGEALAQTWSWLRGVRAPDFGISHLERPAAELVERVLAPRDDAPVLFPSHLDAWAQTWPVPEPDPDVSFWLHGLRPTATDVQVIWRADLTRSFLSEARPGTPRAADVAALVAACPPGSGEAVSVPLPAVRRWLSGDVLPVEVADVEGAAVLDEDPATRPSSAPRPVVRWRGDETSVLLDPKEVGPGDTIVVPSEYGGLAQGSWDPAATDPVGDLGHAVQLRQRPRVVLRLVPGLLPPGFAPPTPVAGDSGNADVDAVIAWLDEPRDRGGQTDRVVATIIGHLAHHRKDLRVRRHVTPLPDSAAPTSEPPSHFVCSAVVPQSERDDGDEASLAATTDSEPSTSSFAGPIVVSLDDHLGGVGRWAKDLAGRCGLPPELVDDLALAGRLHDLGKLDPRFQLWLHGGDELNAAAAPAALAKSAVPDNDLASRQRARERSGYPRGARHELLSVALVQGADALRRDSHDWDLVLHLIASHHGFCRPFPPVVVDPVPVEVRGTVAGTELRSLSDHDLARLDSGVPDRFWSLVRRYGWFQLAWLEAIFRLADHGRSAEEQGGTS